MSGLELSWQRNSLIWAAFVIFFPIIVWTGYIVSPVSIAEIPVWHVVGFTILMIILALIPIIVADVPIFLMQGVSLAVFLSFGLFVEMTLTILGVVALLIYVRISKAESYRIPINLLMFSLASLASGFIFYFLGGVHGSTNLLLPSVIVPILAHQFTYFMMNQLGLYFITNYIHRMKKKFYSIDTKWDGVTSIVVLPVGIILYMLYQQVDVAALFYVGLPFVILALILRLYHNSEKVNSYLQRAADVGHEMTEKLNVQGVLDIFLEKVTAIFPADYAAIINVLDEKEFRLLREINKHNIDAETKFMYYGGICYDVLISKKGVCYETNKKWKKPEVDKQYTLNSLMCVPVIRNQQVVGLIILAKKKKRAYDKSQLMILDILASHFGVAVEKARHYEETKKNSERCALTKLYNYRFFENVLENEFGKLVTKENTSLSLILLDLDHFKRVNDTYGHQSGNEILIQVANRLSTIVGTNGIVARYGGEEFVILLPNMERKHCYELAEKIRLNLANRAFTLKQHIKETNTAQLVKVTASIGFATAPDDAEDGLSLIRHADRAMYVGAKQAGRNKVAEYRKSS
ncbi:MULTISPECIES: sensor domain-containing diguanylate cyclase [Bacillus]|uniref:sensor domain-containing diguanylate cyclase n=1 Tax=Bacillus TaxID=1386 RepID=UPI000BB8E9B0|nr:MULTISPECIES: sensor domain-containing diguanylate cyclase [Bacillus]